MTEHIVKFDKYGNKHINVKFHAPVKHFKRVETFKYGGRFYKIYVNNRDCVYHIERTEVTSWNTWVIPFAFVAYLPASFFLGKTGAGVVGIECIIALVFWCVAYGVFNYGLKFYESAGN